MRTVVLVLLIALASWLAAYTIDRYYTKGTGGRPPRPRHVGARLSDTADNLFWFLHLSDIHISIFRDPDRVTDLRHFVNDVMKVVNPVLVAATGDLTDAKQLDQYMSRQYEKEWVMYSDAIADVRVPWLDIRGNHDNFDVPSLSHPNNLFKKYRIAKTRKLSYSFKYVHTTPHGNYSFVALDACPSPGVRRPYNFFGLLDEEDITTAEALLTGSADSNHTFLLSHYPSCTITADFNKLRNLLSWCSVHLCGHLHTVGDAVPHMYGRHPDGHLQLELGDWKHHRIYRLVAVDHDLVSFTDTALNQWPLVTITNPKDARFHIQHYEPTNKIAVSSHIRILAFSPSPITSVTVSINGGTPQSASNVPSSPLYVLPWTPNQYKGLNTITVTVKDKADRGTTVTQRFSVDGTLDTMEWLGQLLTLSDLRSLSRMVFIFIWLILSVSILADVVYTRPQYQRVLVPLLIYIAYYGIGPWYVGELMDGVYGLVSVHGLLVDGQFVPGGVTYAHALVEILLFQIPLYKYTTFLLTSRKKQSLRSGLVHFIFAVLFLVQCYGVFCTGRVYSWTAVVLSPGHGWSIPFTLWVLYKSHTSSRTHIPK